MFKVQSGNPPDIYTPVANSTLSSDTFKNLEPGTYVLKFIETSGNFTYCYTGQNYSTYIGSIIGDFIHIEMEQACDPNPVIETLLFTNANTNYCNDGSITVKMFNTPCQPWHMAVSNDYTCETTEIDFTSISGTIDHLYAGDYHVWAVINDIATDAVPIHLSNANAPVIEICDNNTDDDCNGLMDENIELPINSIDDDCDGRIDELQIPVVIHMVYHDEADRNQVSEEFIAQLISDLNKDFSGTNSDIGQVDPNFQSNVGHSNIEFVLAKQDPEGNATTGIVYRKTNITKFLAHNESDPYEAASSSGDLIKHTNTGGDDPWDPFSYYNIWIGQITQATKQDGILLGYATFPENLQFNTDLDGVVLSFVTTLIPDKKAISHETGHYFGLRHIWGDKNHCSGDDGIEDTPKQKGPNDECTTPPVIDGPGASCSDPRGANIQNYMDYSACPLMFTNGQVSKMQENINTYRSDLLTSVGNSISSHPCDATITTNDPLAFCPNQSIAATLSANSGTAYLWNNGSTTQSIVANVAGAYSVTVYNCNCQATSMAVNLGTSPCPPTVGLQSYDITSNAAGLHWVPAGCEQKLTLKYRPSNEAVWVEVPIDLASFPDMTLENLMPATQYTWMVISKCGAGTLAKSAKAKFTTLPLKETLNMLPSISEVLTIYPNPTQGTLNYKIERIKGNSATLEIKNILGKLMWHANMPVENETTTGSIDISSFPAGVYFIYVGMESGEVVLKKFLKQ